MSMLGKVSWILIAIGMIVIVLGFIPIPYPKIKRYIEWDDSSVVVTKLIYFELNPWYTLLGLAVFFMGVQLAYQKTLPCWAAFYCCLLIALCSFFLFVRADWFIISLLTILASSTYVSYKLNYPELAFKTIFSTTILVSIAFLSIVLVFPASIDLIFPKSRYGYPFYMMVGNVVFAAIIAVAIFAFISTIINVVGIVLSLFIPRKSEG